MIHAMFSIMFPLYISSGKQDFVYKPMLNKSLPREIPSFDLPYPTRVPSSNRVQNDTDVGKYTRTIKII